MFDTVNLRIDRVNLSSGNPSEVLPYLSDVTEHSHAKKGHSISGTLGNYHVYANESCLWLGGSLAKHYYGDNIHTLTRKDTQRAIEKVSDGLHLNVGGAKVTRLDVSTVIPTKHPPVEYYPFLGDKPHFKRRPHKTGTLYYDNYQRQFVFYDKAKEATAKGVQIPEILQNSYLFRPELRYLKRINRQLKTDVTAAKLYDVEFYRFIIQNWYKEFKSIQKLNNQSFMIGNISTIKEAETAFFAHFLQQAGQPAIDEYLAALKAGNVFKERQRYSELKRKLNTILQAPKGEQSDLMRELETAIFDIARYAR
jgi:hypothetical protein